MPSLALSIDSPEGSRVWLGHCRIFSGAQRLIISLIDLSLRSDIVDPRRPSAPAYELS
jgi:hypothetical protein